MDYVAEFDRIAKEECGSSYEYGCGLAGTDAILVVIKKDEKHVNTAVSGLECRKALNREEMMRAKIKNAIHTLEQ